MKAQEKNIARFQRRRTLRLTGEEDTRLTMLVSGGMIFALAL